MIAPDKHPTTELNKPPAEEFLGDVEYYLLFCCNVAGEVWTKVPVKMVQSAFAPRSRVFTSELRKWSV